MSYSSYDRFISGSVYDDLMKLQRERHNVLEEKSELSRLRDLYGRDVKSYLEDYLSGRIPPRFAWLQNDHGNC